MAYPDRVIVKLVTTATVSLVLLTLSGVVNATNVAASANVTTHAVSSNGRLVQLNGAVVSSLIPTEKKLEVVRKNTSTTYTIQYSATTMFYGSRLKSIKVGTKVTVAGILTGTTIFAQRISTRTPTSTSTSGIVVPDFGASGPFVGLKYVGNI